MGEHVGLAQRRLIRTSIASFAAWVFGCDRKWMKMGHTWVYMGIQLYLDIPLNLLVLESKLSTTGPRGSPDKPIEVEVS